MTILRSRGDAIIVTDIHGSIIFMNRVAEILTGWKRKDAIGQNLTTVFNIINEQVRIDYTRSARETSPESFVGDLARYTRLLAKDGTEVFIENLVALIKDDGGNIIRSVLVFRDITEHQRVEEALRAQARRQAVVATLGQRALAGIDLSLLMDEAAALASQSLGAEYSWVLELLPDGNTLLLRAGVGWKEGLVGRLTMDAKSDPEARYTLLSPQPVIIEDRRSEKGSRGLPLLNGHGVVSGLSVVISGQRRPFGVLGVYTTERRAFTMEDIHFLQAVANVLAAATERKQAEESRTRLLKRVMSAQEEERRRIARELHDETGQALTSLLVGLRLIDDMRTLKTAKAQAHRLRHSTAQILDNLGRLARGLHPSILDDLGLVGALTHYATDYAQSHGIAVNVHTQGLDSSRWPALVATALYRIVQEALTNIAKHAAAKTVSIILERRPSEVQMTVTDDGCGFDVETTLRTSPTSNRLGLYGMRERAVLLGGSMTIESKPGKGTTISVQIPLEG